MAGKKVATVGANHICPMVSGTTPHVGGPVVGPGSPGVFIDGQPVAVVGDTCVCNGPPDVIVQGCPGVLIDGKPIVVEGCMTAHGGVVVEGVPGVTISTTDGKAPAIKTIPRIPFPKIRLSQRATSALTGSHNRIKKTDKGLNELKESTKDTTSLPDFDFSD